MISTDRYAWQDISYQKWQDADYYGMIKGVCSAGKTISGCKCIRAYLEDMGDECEVMVVAPTHEILNQWMKEPLLKEVKHISFLTYLTAVSRLFKRTSENKWDVPSLLILDEVHTATAPTSGQILNFGVPHVLGLSATPNGIEKVLPIIQTVEWSCANIAPTTVHYLFFTPTKEEQEKYDKRTASIHKYELDHFAGYSKSQLWAKQKTDQIYSMLFLNRRNTVYDMKSREDIALKLVKENLGKRMIIFFERKKHIASFSAILKSYNIDHCIHIADNEHIEEYISGEKNIVLVCKKIVSGFSDPTTDMGIVVSTALGKANHVQIVGRIIRPREGKHADIWVLLADGTTDTTLYDARNQMFTPDMVEKDIYTNGDIRLVT